MRLHAPPASRLSALTVLLVLAACAPKGPSPEAMVAAADSLDQQFLAGYNAQDANAVMATYWHSPELVSIALMGTPLSGWDANLAAYQASLPTMTGAELSFTDSHNTVVGDVVLGWGSWASSIPMADGTTLVLQGRYSDVKALRDGKWVYIMDHASVPMTMPAAN